MLPQRHRLKKEKDFTSVLRERRRVEGTGLFLKTKKNKLEESRFGIVVSKRVAKKAVDRNRIHRQLSESIWNLLDRIQGGTDVVIIANADIKNLSKNSTQEALQKALLKTGVLN